MVNLDSRLRDHRVNELGPKSVITLPSGEDHLHERGNYTITGLAWSGGGAIRKVEVSVDGGRNWTAAKLRGPALKRAFTRFDLVWKLTVAFGGAPAAAQELFGVGRTATPEEVHEADITVGPEGKERPPGYALRPGRDAK